MNCIILPILSLWKFDIWIDYSYCTRYSVQSISKHASAPDLHFGNLGFLLNPCGHPVRRVKCIGEICCFYPPSFRKLDKNTIWPHCFSVKPVKFTPKTRIFFQEMSLIRKFCRWLSTVFYYAKQWYFWNIRNLKKIVSTVVPKLCSSEQSKRRIFN